MEDGMTDEARALAEEITRMSRQDRYQNAVAFRDAIESLLREALGEAHSKGYSTGFNLGEMKQLQEHIGAVAAERKRTVEECLEVFKKYDRDIDRDSHGHCDGICPCNCVKEIADKIRGLGK
jgi:hypothetical protein